jgi:acetylornithine deacetylase
LPEHPLDLTLEHLRQLVGINTVSSQANSELTDYLGEVLTHLGFKIQVEQDPTGDKINLIARLGPDEADGLMFAGHTDVVPTTGQAWNSDPFQAETRGDKIYGRGTCDMKGFIAVVLGILPTLNPQKLRCPLYLAFTCDEEIGCFGARDIAPTLAEMTNRPAKCIIGEPTSMKLVAGHKGKLSVDCAVHGAEGHSAFNHHGINAVEIAAELVTYLRNMQSRIRSNGPFDTRFDPPYTTVHTGLLMGGTARNIVPRDCRFEFEIRNLPGHDPHDLLSELNRLIDQVLLPEMHAIKSGSGIEIKIQSDIPGLMNDPRGQWPRHLMNATKDNSPKFVSFATEGGLYQASGVDTIICGPGNIEQAHKADEYVEIAQLAACEKFLTRVIRDNLYTEA